MLDGDDDGAAIAYLGLRGQREEGACAEGDDRSDGGLGWRFIFVVAEGTGIEDAVCTLVVLDGLVAEVDCRLWSASGKFRSVFVEIVQVILHPCQY